MCGSLSRTTRDGSNHFVQHVVVTQPDDTGERAIVSPSAREIHIDENIGYVTRLVTSRSVVLHHEGASAERVTIAERSRATFEEKWADQLATKPDRSLLETDPTRVCDHLCESTTLERVSRDEIDLFATKAASDPRDRYIAVIDVADDSQLHLLRRAYGHCGLEIRSSKTWPTP